MTNQIRLTTTGLTNPVEIADLGAVSFSHSTTNFVLNDTTLDNSEFSLDELWKSNDLQTAIDNGDIILDNENGIVIENLKEYIRPTVKYNVLEVDANPSAKKFTSISAALDSISGSSDSNRFIIQATGIFIEPELDFSAKPYVSLVGSSIQSLVIKPIGIHNIMKIGTFNEISFCWLEDSPIGFAAMRIEDSGNYSQCHKVTFNNCHIGIHITSATQDTYFYGEYIDFNGSFLHAVKVEATNSFVAFANLENFYVYPTDIGVATQGVYITGNGSDVFINSSGLLGIGVGQGVYIEDDAKINIGDTYITSFDIGVYNANVGSATLIDLISVAFRDNISYDLQILQPSTNGGFTGVASHVKIDNQAPNFVWNYLDIVDGEMEITNNISVTFDDGTHTDLSTLVFQGSNMGVFDGGILSDGGGLNLNVSAGFGYLDDISTGIIKRYDWTGQTLILNADSDNFIYINSGGLFIVSNSPPLSLFNVIFIGRVYTNTSDIAFIDAVPMIGHHTANKLSTFNRVALGSIYSSGSIVSEGSALKLNVTTGRYFRSEVSFLPSGGNDIQFTQYHHNGSSAWVLTSTDTLNNTQYNNGNTLTSLTLGFYTKHSLYVVGEGANEKYFVVLGQGEYASVLLAQSGVIPTPPIYFDRGVVLLALIYVQEGSGNIILIEDARPIIGFKPLTLAGSSDHSTLLNLNVDSHTQYLLANGGRNLSGDLNLGGNNITNVNLVDGVDVSDHVSRHLPNGADPLTTAAPNANLNGSSTNATGNANSFARSNHTHAIDEATITEAGLLSATDKVKLNNTSGTNSGDQTTIVGISSTKSQFNTACSDGNFLYVGDVVSNVPTALSSGTITAISYGITSDGGTDDLVLPQATITEAGLLSATDKVKLNNTSGTNSGDQTITLTSDVTGSGTGSFAATIAADAVTNAKLANVATQTFKGRTTAATGDPEDLTVTQATAMLNVFTSGLKGLVPASGGGSTIYLNADGTFTTPSASVSMTSVNAAGNITTTLATDAVVTTMTITPVAGTYLVLFNTNISHSVSSGTINLSIYVNGVQTANSARLYTQATNNAGNVTTSHACLSAIVTVTGVQAIDVRWNRGASGTATMGNRILTIIKQ